jgi:hypothetical protein
MGALDVLIIIGVVACILLFSAQIMAVIGKFAPQAQDWLNSILGGFGLGGGNSEGITALGFHISYFDGTSQDVNNNASFNVLPLNIFYGGKQVESIDVNIRAKVTNGSMSSWSSETTLTVTFSDSEATSAVTPITFVATDTGASWANGAIYVVCTRTLGWHELELLLNPASPHTYPHTTHWHISASAIVKLTTGGTSFSSTPVTGAFDIDYDVGWNYPTSPFAVTTIKTSGPAYLKP